MKQRYGTELRSRTLATLKPEISQALDSLLEELRNTEDARAMRTQFSSKKKPHHRKSRNHALCVKLLVVRTITTLVSVHTYPKVTKSTLPRQDR